MTSGTSLLHLGIDMVSSRILVTAADAETLRHANDAGSALETR
jgi:hypothetical protein